MKFLNEDIEVTVTFAAISKDQVLKYKISNSNNENIFVGNCFVLKGSTSKTFYLNDILKTFQYQANTTSVNTSVKETVMDRYTLQLGYESTVLGTATTDWVILCNRYPAYKKYLDVTVKNNSTKTNPDTNVLLDPDTTNDGCRLRVLLQGQNCVIDETGQGQYDYYYTPILIPHYPGVYSDKYPVRVVYQNYTDEIEWTYGCDSGWENYDYTTFSPFGEWCLGTKTMQDIVGGTFTEDGFVYGYVTENLGQDNFIRNEVDCAVIDSCPGKYYLMWQDRYGGIQSQAFSGTDTISFDYTVTYQQTYKNEKKAVSNSQTIKWKINSGWLNDKIMPIYESIFVSPFLKLYDVENDEVYDVNLTDNSYTEKTYKNQQKLFNLELNLELNKNQLQLY